uniref:Phospholipid/glycerol acyltransferase domain-containing protein n=1 Tax=Zooxanthella nutricula TaxID=1333877 RepID=A0A7S2IG38_9DINO
MGCSTTLAVLSFNTFLALTTLPPYIVAKASVLISCVKPLNPLSCRRRAVTNTTCLCWRLLWNLCCWIGLEVDGLREFRQSLGASGKPAVIVSNHLSFLDTLLLVPLTPLRRVADVKMFVSSHLTKIPVLRTIIGVMGHVVVPFKPGNRLGSFELDRELMAVRQQELEDHVRAGGIAAWFPEGQMNTGDPREVATFRAGGFALPVRVDVEIWCAAFTGNSDCWPRSAKAGGRPSRIRGKIFKLCDSSWAAVAKEAGGPGAQDEKQASMFLANHAHDLVQRAVSELAAEAPAGAPVDPLRQSLLQ